jgi:beta-galactosidase
MLRGGAYKPSGISWYRRQFSLSVDQATHKFFIEFDGVMANSEVWINGHLLGKRPNGYISFCYDLTPWLKYGAEKNTIAVKVNNAEQPNSRWYSGSGIYRNVWLVTTNPVRVDHWGTYITTPIVNKESAYLSVATSIKNDGETDKQVELNSTVYDASGVAVATISSDARIQVGKSTETVQNIVISKPRLWSVNDPYLYRVVTRVCQIRWCSSSASGGAATRRLSRRWGHGRRCRSCPPTR